MIVNVEGRDNGFRLMAFVTTETHIYGYRYAPECSWFITSRDALIKGWRNIREDDVPEAVRLAARLEAA